MTEHAFTHDLDVGNITIAQLEGFVLLHTDPVDKAEWAISSIHLEGYGGSAKLPEDHYLYAPIMTWLLNTQRREIDETWDAREPEVVE